MPVGPSYWDRDSPRRSAVFSSSAEPTTGTALVWGTSVRNAPRVTSKREPSSRATASTVSVKVRHLTLGSLQVNTTTSLERAVEEWEESVAKLIHESEDLTEYVARLEAAADESLREVVEPASGESIAAELERFLREQDRKGPPA